ncbi:aldehyde dehydrogenase [Aspergillus homomorphus CBS 101889]|uniref:aldehyde dehydrogenase (NAD(+)) n=1 Tax=Aspergillus homomorphus (strain CBS 101889) TaxID=1450537 RepID=A0A395HLE3_ASPHC|nr:aldehyde dehydrogenase [Aspergillus homomorphus CBS 101889]RAL08045.1 aldehyde dehydrogenase [Aspergillus homomorphus CBS 101889]
MLGFSGASSAGVDKAAMAARAASEGSWSELAVLLALIDALDDGKLYSAALGEVLEESYQVFKYYGGAADKINGDTIETSPAKLAYVLREPLGVCGQIISWNYPFMMLAWKVASALACGNTVVLKPAEQTPLSAMYFGKFIQEADLPPGMVNIIPGPGSEAGKTLAEQTDVDKVAFTGSTNTGRMIMRSAVTDLKNITLEYGGKSPCITHMGIISNQGEVEDIYDEFLYRFAAKARSQKTGDTFTEGNTMGAIQGKKSGARLLASGVWHGSKGYFIEPTVFADTTEDMAIVPEEIFGAMVTISKFKAQEEAIERANDTSYGLAAAIFTGKVDRAHIVARKLQAGMVWINSSQDSHCGIPFGGYKSSDIGRELGKYALDAYTQAKAVHVNIGLRL